MYVYPLQASLISRLGIENEARYYTMYFRTAKFVFCLFYFGIGRLPRPGLQEPNHGNAAPNVGPSSEGLDLLGGASTCSGNIERQCKSLREPRDQGQSHFDSRTASLTARGQQSFFSRNTTGHLALFHRNHPGPRSQNPIFLPS